MTTSRWLVTQERYQSVVSGGDPQELIDAIELEIAKAKDYDTGPVTWKVEGSSVVIGWDASCGMVGVSNDD